MAGQHYATGEGGPAVDARGKWAEVGTEMGMRMIFPPVEGMREEVARRQVECGRAWQGALWWAGGGRGAVGRRSWRDAWRPWQEQRAAQKRARAEPRGGVGGD